MQPTAVAKLRKSRCVRMSNFLCFETCGVPQNFGTKCNSGRSATTTKRVWGCSYISGARRRRARAEKDGEVGKRLRAAAGCRPAMAADLASKPRLQVGQTHPIARAGGVDHDGVRAFVVGAIDDEPGRAGLPHFGDGNLSRALHFDRWWLRPRSRGGTNVEPETPLILCRQASIRS
jgi:hypothetical protein